MRYARVEDDDCRECKGRKRRLELTVWEAPPTVTLTSVDVCTLFRFVPFTCRVSYTWSVQQKDRLRKDEGGMRSVLSSSLPLSPPALVRPCLALLAHCAARTPVHQTRAQPASLSAISREVTMD